MQYFHYIMDAPEIHLYPLVCWHIGAKQSCLPLITEVIRRIKSDPLARAIYMGDAGECVIKSSKGNIYEQLLNPGDQLRVAAKLKRPIADKIIGGIRGNHGNRIDKDTGVGWDEMLCERVGVPYWGVSALGNIELGAPGSAHQSFSLYVHHGNSGSITPGGKTAAGTKPSNTVWADIALTAHTHACGEIILPRHIAVADPTRRIIRWETMRMYVCGSAYDSRSGYAEEKQYPPILPQHLMIRIKLTAEGLAISHETIDGFGTKYISVHDRAKWRKSKLRVAA